MKKHMQPLKTKGPEDLNRDLQEARVKLDSLRFDLAHGKIKNPEEIRTLKKTIARILTLLQSK